MVNEKRKTVVPAEIEETCDAISRKIDAQLDETEQFIISKRVKALDDSVACIQEAHKRIDSFASEAVGKLRTSMAESVKAVKNVHKSLQFLNKINTKWQALEKERNLTALAKQYVTDLKQEVRCLSLNYFESHISL